MTNYSIVRPEDPTDPGDVADAQLESFLHGAARGLLDTAECIREGTSPDDSETEEACAVWWHSSRAGWEEQAIHPDDRARFRERVTAFVEANRADLVEVAAAILRTGHPDYVTSIDAAWYRAGELYPYTARGFGIGLWEYGDAGKRLNDVVERERHGLSAYAYPDDDSRPYAQLNEV